MSDAETTSNRVPFTLSQKVYIIKMYYQCKANPRKALIALSSRFGIKSSIENFAIVIKIVHAFERTGSIVDHFSYDKTQTVAIPVTQSVRPKKRRKPSQMQILDAADDDLLKEVLSELDKDKARGEAVKVEQNSKEQSVTITDDEKESVSDKMPRSFSDSEDDGDLFPAPAEPKNTPQDVQEEQLARERRYSLCPECGIELRNQSLSRHMEKHNRDENKTADSRHKCPQCDMTFRTQSGLSSHKRKHDKNLHFICEVCGRVFTEKASLKGHILCHSDEKPHQCPHCPMKFRKTLGLRTHLMTHTGEKPLSCTVCKAKFRAHMTLNMHMRLHTGERPYACSHCDKRFIGQPALNSHLKKYHVETFPNECEVCGGRYKTQATLRGHMEKRHGGGVDSKKNRS